MPSERYQHIFLRGPSNRNAFTSTVGGRDQKNIPHRDRQAHYTYISGRLEEAWRESKHEQAAAHVTRSGVYIEFRSDPDSDLITKRLENLRPKKNRIRLLNVRTVEKPELDPETGIIENVKTTYATVYVPHEQKNYFLKKLQQYAEEETEKGNPRHDDFIRSIADIRKALLVESFWQDTPSLIPQDEAKWCEVWLRNETEDVVARFESLLVEHQIQARSGTVKFPERAVKVVLADREQLAQLTTLSDDIAEYRLAKQTAAFWTEMENREQAEWVVDLQSRLRVDEGSDVSVCILDTGVNNGHPLLSPILDDGDCQAVMSRWGTHDHDGHGTLMAGVAAYGDLKACLESMDTVSLGHQLESVKILPPPPESNSHDLWGDIVTQGIALSEIQAAERNRVHVLAVTASDTRDRGRPSSWSGQIDQLASGAEGGRKRLIVVSAGNTTNGLRPDRYPHAQVTDSIHDPAQAWNALTVGAYTELVEFQNPTLEGYSPLAPQGALSPFSTTSTTWEDKWPSKPEIVMEGGNAIHDGVSEALDCEDLSILSTYHDLTVSHFYPFNMTSAATAQAAWLAARIQQQYHDAWPETVRGLMIHSARWTDSLKKQFLADDSKGSYGNLIRICGYGVPDLGRALYSASNSLTLISQAEMQPYDKKEFSGYKTKEMHLYDLPWPTEVLLGLPPDVRVEMRITLSYFIEPGPGEIGWRDRYRYPSHVLRFDINSPRESKEEFVKRINKASRDEDEGRPETESASEKWRIGSRARNKGSVHSDIWEGTAADLATSNLIAVYPLIGWWRERSHLGKWDSKTRYALIVSISTPEEDVDIYTPVANEVGITVPVEV